MKEAINTLGIVLTWVLALGVYLGMVGLGCGTVRLAYKDYMKDGGLFDLTMLIAFTFISVSLAVLPFLCVLDHLLK